MLKVTLDCKIMEIYLLNVCMDFFIQWDLQGFTQIFKIFLIVQKVEFVKNTYTPILHIAIFRRSEFSCFIPTNVKAD
jgi:hypothetical protein